MIIRIFLSSFVCFFVTATGAYAQASVFADDAFASDKHFYQCLAFMGPGGRKEAEYKDEKGYIGPYQFGIATAYEGGLCSKPVPQMRQEQIWSFCDFNGPIAQKYGFRDEYDFRFDAKALTAQTEMMKNLVKKYDRYIYQHKYDLFFGKYRQGVKLTADDLRVILHTKGRAVLDEFMHDQKVLDIYNQEPFTMINCYEQCIVNNGKKWYCN